MQPNILLVVLDSVQAKNVSLYGYEHETTPALSDFAERATTYTQARAPSFWSLPSHASMFTGYHVEEHRITSRSDKLEAGHTIWERLGSDHGYATGLFSTNNFLVADSFGLNRGFKTNPRSDLTEPYFSDGLSPFEMSFDGASGISKHVAFVTAALRDDYPVKSLANGVIQELRPYLSDQDYGSRKLNDAEQQTEEFLDWHADVDGPWAACINVLDAHNPFRPSPDHDRWGGERLHSLHEEIDNVRWDFYAGKRPWWQRKALEALYDGSIRQADAAVGRLLDTLEKRGELDKTLVVITSDHGEGFGEPSRVRDEFRICGHTGGIHELLVHVPLVVKFPGQTEPSKVTNAASLTRFPTVAERIMDGDYDVDEFVPPGPVLVTCDHDSFLATKPQTNALKDVDMDRFRGRARAVYVNADQGVKKYVRWSDDEATIHIIDPQNSLKLADASRMNMNVPFDDLSGRGVSVANAEVDEQTHENLRHMGYL